MNNTLIQRINQRLAETGKAAQTVSREATGAKDTLRKILDGTTKHPRIDTIIKIASVLDTSPEWLMGRDESAEKRGRSTEVEQASSKAQIDNQPEKEKFGLPAGLPQRQDMPNDVKVLGTAAGSHLRGAFQIFGDIIDYVRRPPALMGSRNVYALYVEGTSMEPQYFPGDLIYVHPDRPPRIGDAVVIQAAVDGENLEATIGIYRRQTEQNFIISKHNPQAEVQIKRSVIKAVHKVLTINELFGV